LSTDAPTELKYYLGGLDFIRGYADSLVRTQRFALVNAELRGVIFDSMWFAVMGAVFVDGALSDDGRALTPLLSAGGGLRLLVPRLVKTGIRADVAVTLTGRPAPGFSFGVYQFF
jgi:outer membrane protein assembly factor BamA